MHHHYSFYFSHGATFIRIVLICAYSIGECKQCKSVYIRALRTSKSRITCQSWPLSTPNTSSTSCTSATSRLIWNRRAITSIFSLPTILTEWTTHIRRRICRLSCITIWARIWKPSYQLTSTKRNCCSSIAILNQVILTPPSSWMRRTTTCCARSTQTPKATHTGSTIRC